MTIVKSRYNKQTDRTAKMNLYWSAVLIGLTLAGLTQANREHKVHNIVLYPDRHSWCSTRNISQVISYPGCKQVTIDNNVCVGACFSYSIPHTEPSDPGEVIGPYCDSCQPSETSWHNVTLDCSENSNNNGDEEDKPAFLVKRVQIITNCSCASCEKQTHKKHHHHHQQQHHHQQEQQHNHISSTTSSLIHDDIPELLEVVPYSENDTDPALHHSAMHAHQSENHVSAYIQQHHLNHYEHNSHTENVKKLLHQKITALIESIEKTNSKQDREQLAEMIKLIKGSSDRNWDTLVDSLQSENSILDFDRLRSELEVEEEDQFVVKEQKVPEQEDHQRLLKHQFDVLSHLPHGQQQTHHHVAGERLDQHHHLERGPHGALVIASDDDGSQESPLHHGYEITEKMNILPHQLKPNHAGAILSYDNHHSERASRAAEHHHPAPHHHHHHSGKQ